MLERDLQRRVNKILRQIPGLWFYHPKEGKRGTKGIPDIIGCFKGKFFAIELKSPRLREPAKGLAPEQQEVLEEIKQAGGKIAIINNIDDLIYFLENL